MATDNPVIFKRTKSKPTQTTRAKSPDITQSVATDSPITLASKLKNRTKTKRSSRLSFGGDDEPEGDGEVFQVKKSNLSQKLSLRSRPGSPWDALPASFDKASISPRSNGPMYDQAYLSELKASTPTTRPPILGGDPYDADMSMDADVSLDDVSTFEAFNESTTSMLSESSIRSVKEKRQRLRKTGHENEEDFISLSITKRSDEPQGPHPESRLMREEDDLGDGDDEFAEYTSAQERIALGKKSKKKEASQRRDEMKEMIIDVEDDEEDEDAAEWAQEQARRGGQFTDDRAGERAKQTYKPAPIPPPAAIPTLGPAVARLAHSMTALATSNTSNMASMSSVAEERAKIDARETELREMIDRAERKRSWFAAFREWVESVATFLDEKFPLLEKLEDEHISILKERSDMINKRRRLDDEDDLSIFLGSLPSAAPSDVEEVDDQGRIVPAPNPLAAHRDRRTARTTRRTYRRARSQTTDEEGYSTDSSLPSSDAADYQTALKKLSSDGVGILSDVRAEGFRDPGKGIGKWFGEWREKWEESYTGAWGGLALVGAWEFWVRLELMVWNPFEDSRSLDSFTWYSALYEYSRPPLDKDDEEPELGPDGDLVSAMISTALIPRLCKIVESGAFDAYSAKGMRRILDLAEQVEASVQGDGAKFQSILKSVSAMFQAVVTNCVLLISPYLALNSPRFDPEAFPARQRFLVRRIKLLQNILRWRKYTGERDGIGELATRLLSEIIVPIAESGWDVGGHDAVRKAVVNLPVELVPTSVKARLANV